MKHIVLTITILFIACNPVEVVKNSKHLNTLITIEYTNTIDQVTKSRSFYVSTQYLKMIIKQYGWLHAYKSKTGYRGYCRSFTIKRDGDLVSVRFIGAPIGYKKLQDFVWVEQLTDEKLYRNAMCYYEPIEYSYFEIYVGGE